MLGTPSAEGAKRAVLRIRRDSSSHTGIMAMVRMTSQAPHRRPRALQVSASAPEIKCQHGQHSEDHRDQRAHGAGSPGEARAAQPRRTRAVLVVDGREIGAMSLSTFLASVP